MAYYTLNSYKLNISPLSICQALSQSKGCFFLDSSLNNVKGRYSFLGAEPFLTISAHRGEPLVELKKVLQDYYIPFKNLRLPFIGGAVGFLSYDAGVAFEKKITHKTRNDIGIPAYAFGIYNTFVAIDHFKGRLFTCAVGFPEKKTHFARLLCRENIKKISGLLSRASDSEKMKSKSAATHQTSLTSNFTKDEYKNTIRRAKEYIRQGDIYQVNLSQRFCGRTDKKALSIYGTLRSISPSCFSAYFDYGDYQIMSSSPERLINLHNRIAVTVPMKGTRKRTENPRRNNSLKRELLGSVMDMAELTMLVDLERNDLGRVCDYDSIRVDTLREVEEYSTVFQTTATISGTLHKSKDRFDLIRACFPGGSITGCPKIRAMEIIGELEPNSRSLYTGSAGYLSFTGDMDFNILIRTILKRGKRISFGVGGGIVADSDPEEEYNETLVKARAMIQALSQ